MIWPWLTSERKAQQQVILGINHSDPRATSESQGQHCKVETRPTETEGVRKVQQQQRE